MGIVYLDSERFLQKFDNLFNFFLEYSVMINKYGLFSIFSAMVHNRCERCSFCFSKYLEMNYNIISYIILHFFLNLVIHGKVPL